MQCLTFFRNAIFREVSSFRFSRSGCGPEIGLFFNSQLLTLTNLESLWQVALDVYHATDCISVPRETSSLHHLSRTNQVTSILPNMGRNENQHSNAAYAHTAHVLQCRVGIYYTAASTDKPSVSHLVLSAPIANEGV